MFKTTLCLSLSLFLLSCSSTTKDSVSTAEVIPQQSEQLSEADGLSEPVNSSPWAKKITQFYNADIHSVILPYMTSVRSFDNLSEEQLCSADSLSKVTKLLTLNPSSLFARSFFFACPAWLAGDMNEDTLMAEIEGIASSLLSETSGESIEEAIEVRELDEAHIILELSGFQMLDSEIFPNGDEFVFKYHVIDTETGKFEHRYFKNLKLLQHIYQRVQASITIQQTVKLVLSSYMQKKLTAALIPKARMHLFDKQYGEVIELLKANALDSGLASTLLAEAYFRQGNTDELYNLIDTLDTLSNWGLIEAKVLLAEIILVNAEGKTEYQEVDRILLDIDSLTSANRGATLLASKLATHDNAASLIKRWLANTEHPTFAEALTIAASSTNNMGFYNKEAQLQLLSVAADRQDPKALFKLANWYLSGNKVKKDENKGVELLTRAAELGHSDAQLDLGFYYGMGQLGLEQDYNTAYQWYLKSANQSNPIALSNLGIFFRDGTAVQQDIVAAESYFQKSIAAGNEKAFCYLGDLYRDNSERYSIEKAIESYKNGADVGQSSCQYSLGETYKESLQNYAESIKWYLKAGESGDNRGYFSLALLYDDGTKVSQNYSKAIEYYQLAAEAGHDSALSNLGYMYEAGKGVASNNQKALEYYLKAEELKNDQGINNLATFYLEGIVVDQDKAKALSLYKEAAALGNDYALNNLGKMYRDGNGVQVNHKIALDYFIRASKEGFISSYENAGIMYFKGQGAEKSLDKAIKYLSVSSAKGYAVSSYYLGDAYFTDGELQDLDKAIEYLTLSTEQGDKDAPLFLGEIYRSDEFGLYDKNKSKKWHNKSVEVGNLESMPYLAALHWDENKTKSIEILSEFAATEKLNANFFIGTFFHFEHYITPNYKLAHEYYSKGMAEGDPGAANNLGELYREGKGAELDYVKALAFYKKAAELNSLHAFYNLGEMHRDGHGVSANAVTALGWFKKAAEEGFLDAMYQLGLMYQQGVGTQINISTANEWFSKASDEGFSAAQLALGKNLVSGEGTTRDEEQGKALIQKSADSGYQPAITYMEQMK